MKYLLDTNICIYLINQRPKTVPESFNRHALSDIVISSITVAELEFGVAKGTSIKYRKALNNWLPTFAKSAFDAAAARHYGPLRAALEAKGTPIGPLDTLIAAHALSLDVTLVTNNVREFSRVPGLRIENWTTP
ncbi:MAG: type II toxin-antitoxin system VapC family toxin [Pseudomonadota bacterium]